MKRGWKGVQNGGQVACRSSQLLFELQSSAAFGLSNSANRCGCCTFFSVETARCFWSCTPLVHRLYTNITSYACTCYDLIYLYYLYTTYTPLVHCVRPLLNRTLPSRVSNISLLAASRLVRNGKLQVPILNEGNNVGFVVLWVIREANIFQDFLPGPW